MKTKYYTLDRILSENADYNIIYGERSNGKTTAVLAYAIKDYISSNYVNQLAIVRRWEEDFKGKNGQQMFESVVSLGWITDWTDGEYNSIYYYSQRWYFCRYNDKGEKEKQAEFPFAMGFSITAEEHYKSTSYPNIKTILYDEFITRGMYLPDEFIKFQNLLSTLIRLRNDVKIFMCGNTINQFCPYFSEMGLTHIREQKKGSIDIYTYGDGVDPLKVAVEYSEFAGKKKNSNKYFAFDNPKLRMITDGGWEIDIYPHLPVKYLPKDVLYTYYVCFDNYIMECEIIYSNELQNIFTFIHRKTTPIRHDNTNIVYQCDYCAKFNYRRKISQPYDKLMSFIWKFYIEDNVYYQDNHLGEVMRNYLQWCMKN